MSFNEWFEKNGELYREPTNEERYLFEAGAASRQAEIDELQKRIDEAIKVFEEDLSPLIDQIEMVYGILKGDR